MELSELELNSDLHAKVAAAGHSSRMWPVRVGDDSGVVAVLDDGLVVLQQDAETVYAWSDITGVRVETMALHVRRREDDIEDVYPLARVRHRRGLAAAISDAGGPITGFTGQRERASSPKAEHRVLPGTRASTLPLVKSPVNRATAESAQNALRGAFFGGLVAQIVGGVVIAVSWPESSLEYSFLDDPTITEEGSAFGVWTGLVLATFGGFALMLGIIGWGVMLGVRATRND